MTAYAAGTTVSPEKSQLEIQSTLRRYGADTFAVGSNPTRAVVGFTCEGRQVRFELAIPGPDEFPVDSRGYARTATQKQTAAEAETRRRWRALALAIKAKLEVVATGIATFEDEFAANIVLPDGRTVGEWLGPQIEQAYASGTMPELLPPSRRAIGTTNL